MSLAWNGYEIAGLALNGSAVSACYNGELVWPAEQPIVYYSVTFGEGNMYSAGLTAEETRRKMSLAHRKAKGASNV